jgi:hypothetical protein
MRRKVGGGREPGVGLRVVLGNPLYTIAVSQVIFCEETLAFAGITRCPPILGYAEQATRFRLLSIVW